MTTLYIPKEKKIECMPLESVPSSDADIVEWAKEYTLAFHSAWFLPQAVAHFGTFELKPTIKEFLATNINSNWRKGLWRLATTKSRSIFWSLAQTKPDSARYASLTPLIMLGIRDSQNVPYEYWRGKEGLNWLVGERLAEAMQYDPPELSRDDLLEIRTIGCTVKSGAKAGTVKSATGTWALTGLQRTPLADAPTLAPTILTQCWLAHPSIRNRAMVLDLKDWDNYPEPLVSSEVLVSETKQSPKRTTSDDLPWLL